MPSNVTYRVGVIGKNTTLVSALKENKKLNIITINDIKSSKQTINNEKLDALNKFDATNVDITYANVSSANTQVVSTIFGQTSQRIQLESMQKQLQELTLRFPTLASQRGSQKVPTITNHYLYGNSELNPFDNLTLILISFLVFFFVFLIFSCQ